MCEIYSDGDSADLWQVKTKTARKTYACDCCLGLIKPGEKYVTYKSLYDGEWYQERGCIPCDKAQDEFSAAHDEMAWFPQAFREALTDCISEEDDGSGKWAPMLAAIEARGAPGTKGAGK